MRCLDCRQPAAPDERYCLTHLRRHAQQAARRAVWAENRQAKEASAAGEADSPPEAPPLPLKAEAEPDLAESAEAEGAELAAALARVARQQAQIAELQAALQQQRIRCSGLVAEREATSRRLADLEEVISVLRGQQRDGRSPLVRVLSDGIAAAAQVELMAVSTMLAAFVRRRPQMETCFPGLFISIHTRGASLTDVPPAQRPRADALTRTQRAAGLLPVLVHIQGAPQVDPVIGVCGVSPDELIASEESYLGRTAAELAEVSAVGPQWDNPPELPERLRGPAAQSLYKRGWAALAARGEKWRPHLWAVIAPMGRRHLQTGYHEEATILEHLRRRQVVLPPLPPASTLRLLFWPPAGEAPVVITQQLLPSEPVPVEPVPLGG